jgi:SAM-dependent methyltransferase
VGGKVVKNKRDNWFTNYQEIPQLKIKGKRQLQERVLFFKKEDFVNSSVLDLGCNTGQMCAQALEWGASSVTGVDFDTEAIKKARTLHDGNYVADDLDSNFFWNSINPSDIVLFLSVIDTKEIENRYGVLSKACMKTKKVMYFEGHNNENPQKYINNILEYTDFTTIEYLGNTPKSRPFFRCSRDVLSPKQCVEKILKSNHKKIAVVGKGLAGKSTIRKQLLSNAVNKKVIDDLYVCGADKKEKQQEDRINISDLSQYDEFILFDYRALEYYKDFESVFFITPNENLIGQSRNKDKLLRSPFITKKNNKVKEIYTVRSY